MEDTGQIEQINTSKHILMKIADYFPQVKCVMCRKSANYLHNSEDNLTDSTR